MKIFISGATGFLGGALSKHWADLGHDVVALLRNKSAVKREGLEALGIKVVTFTNLDEVPGLLRDAMPEVVVHTACSYGRAGESVSTMFEVNVALGVALLDGLVQLKNRCHFINTGTVLDDSTNYYALTKWQFSHWAEKVISNFSPPIRFTNVLLQHMYGPFDDSSKFTTYVLHSCQRNVPMLELTEGEQMRDFVHIDDVVGAYNTLVMQVSQLADFEHVQVGSGTAVSIRAFVETAHQITRSTTTLAFGAVPYRSNEAMSCCADITRIAGLGWNPTYEIRSGLIHTIAVESSNPAN